MSTYVKCDRDVHERVLEVMVQHHADLADAGVTVCCLFAHAARDAESGEPKGPAIKHGGYAAAAVTKIVSLKDRAKGCADAEIIFDGDRWGDWSEAQQTALIDHELQHLALCTKGVSDDPVPDVDDLGRPKLKTRQHDHQFGWFDAIAERHGAHSFEVQQAVTFVDAKGQLYLPFLGDPMDKIIAKLDARRQRNARSEETEEAQA